MSVPKFIDIDGKRYLWRDIVQIAAGATVAPQPKPNRCSRRSSNCTRTSARINERNAANRYLEPSLFS